MGKKNWWSAYGIKVLKLWRKNMRGEGSGITPHFGGMQAL